MWHLKFNNNNFVEVYLNLLIHNEYVHFGNTCFILKKTLQEVSRNQRSDFHKDVFLFALYNPYDFCA